MVEMTSTSKVGLWQELEGHQLTLKPLIEAAAKSRMAGTLLFAGPSGVGKKFSALALTQALVCETDLESRVDHAGCGVCGPCRRVESGQSESLMVVSPDGAQIKIDQARDILKFLNLQKLGRARVVIIDQAHLLGAQAGNALLKALEEPPTGTYFVLVSALPNSILATLRSRSQLVRFKPLSDESIKLILTRSIAELTAPVADAKTKTPVKTPTKKMLKPEKEVKPIKIDEWLLRASHGSVEVAKRLVNERAEYEALEDATAAYMAASLDRFPAEEISALREMLKDRSTHGFVASVIQGAVTDAMKLKSGLKPVVRKGQESRKFDRLITPLAARPARSLELLAQKSLSFEADLARNVDRGLLLEALAVQLSRNG